MSLRVCLGCRTVYAAGPPACPQCGTGTRDAVYKWEDDVVKATEFGATYYVPEGGEVPGELPDAVRLVGPGAAPAPVPVPAREPAATPIPPKAPRAAEGRKATAGKGG